MNEAVRSAAIHVMDEMLAHPICTSFRNPFQPGDSEREYFSRIKDPQDLSTIRTRLVKNEYSDVNDWISDVEKVWANCETYYGKDTHAAIVAGEGRRLFGKYRSDVSALSMDGWRSVVYRLRSRVYTLMGQLPPSVRKFVSGTKQEMPSLTDREIQALVRASTMMTNEEHAGMLRVIDEIQPELDTGAADLAIDVTKMSLTTVYALREYIKSTLEKRGARYPE